MSNGSENMPERCVHAPGGPDWAGLREPSSWKERALAAEAKLDSMTVEWGTKIASEPGVDVGTEEYARRNVDQWNASRYHKGDMRGVVVSRRVSSWTVVEGDDQ